MSDATVLNDLVMVRDQVVEFYSWLLEDDNFDRVVVHTKGANAQGEFTRERCASALENWRTCKPDATMRPSVAFRDDADAVFFKMKFTG